MPRFFTIDMAEVLQVFPSHTPARIAYEDAVWMLESGDVLESSSFRASRKQRIVDPLLEEIRKRIGIKVLQGIRKSPIPTPGRHDSFLFVFVENGSGQAPAEITLGFALIKA